MLAKPARGQTGRMEEQAVSGVGDTGNAARARMPARAILRVGDHDIDLDRRNVVSRIDGGSRRVTRKSLQVLRVLVDEAGNVVSRETLLARVWPDTLPTDDVLTQAIALLRKAFGDDRGAPRYIETIARGGYRLLAAHAWLAAPAAVADPAPDVVPDTPVAAAADPAPAAPAIVRRAWRRWWPLAAAVALLAVALALLLPARFARNGVPAAAAAGPAREASLQYRAIVSSPEQETAPRLSPDGTQLVFARQDPPAGGQRLYLQRTSQASAQPFTFPAGGEQDSLPAWSRDGRQIAFVRRSGHGCHFMLAAADGGNARVAGPCAGRDTQPFDWTPDGGALVAGGMRTDNGSALHRLDLASARWHALAYDVDRDAIDSLPRHSPDGRWLGFRRGTTLGDLWLMPAAGGTPRRVTSLRGDIRGWAWLPDSSGIVFSLVKEEVRLFRVDLAGGAPVPLPVLAGGNPTYPDIAAGHWSMVFEIDRLRSGMFRFRTDGSGGGEPVFASSGVDLTPGISADGSTLAFVSDRSLHAQLWIGQPAHPQTLRAVAGLVPVPRHPPVWSGDGRRLLVIGRGDGGDRLFEVEVGSDTVKPLPVPAPSPAFAAYTDRADRLLVGTDAGQGRLQLMLYSLPDWRRIASLDDVAVARHDPVGRRLCFTRPARTGLWCTDLQLQSVVQYDTRLPDAAHYREWSIVAGTPYYTGPTDGCRTAWLPLGDTHAAGSPRRCLIATQATLPGSSSIDGEGRWFYASLSLEHNIDVGWTSLQAWATTAR